MTDAATQNPFAPPRTHVADQSTTTAAGMVTATRLSRFLAFLVDASPGIVIAIIGVVAALAMVPGLLKGKFDPASINWVAVGCAILVVVVASLAWVVWQIVLLYNYGQTVGKKVLGIRVVRMDGSRVSFARFFFLRGGALVAMRVVAGGIAGAMGIRYSNFAGYLVTLVDALLIFGVAHRCLHDFIADTQVVTAESSPNATLEGARAL